jgi:hypothetical protein
MNTCMADVGSSSSLCSAGLLWAESARKDAEFSHLCSNSMDGGYDNHSVPCEALERRDLPKHNATIARFTIL